MASARRTGTNESISTYGAGQDYTALATWEAATDNDNVAATVSPWLECLASEYEDYVTIGDAIGNATYFRGIRPKTGNFHTGIRDTGVRFYSTQTAQSSIILSDEGYVQIQDLVGKATITNVTSQNTFGAGANSTNCAFVGCIATQGANGHATGVIHGFNTGAAITEPTFFIDCLGENNDGNNFEYGGAGPCHWLNCTSVDAGLVGFSYGLFGTGTVKNCLAQEAVGVCFSGTYPGSGATEYNASSDATAPGTNSRTSQTFTFLNAGAFDFHLASTDAGALNFGKDLSANAAYAFNDGLDRQTRMGTWDIGADEYIAPEGAESKALSDDLVLLRRQRR
mgnify:CR=1 FL=1